MKNRTSKFIALILGVVIAVVAGRMIATSMFNTGHPEQEKSKPSSQKNHYSTSPTVETALRNLTQNTNKKLPVLINSNTRLDWTLTSAKNMTILHTLLDSEHWRTEDFEKLKSDLPGRVCKDEVFSELLPLGATLTYSYRSKKGEPLLSVTIRASDCN